jgi:hypothetical protein
VIDAALGGPVDTDTDELPEIDLDELTSLALAADPDAPIPPDAVPFTGIADEGDGTLLPSWYMPAPGGAVRQGRGWRRVVAITFILAFVILNAAGLCSTYGWITVG